MGPKSNCNSLITLTIFSLTACWSSATRIPFTQPPPSYAQQILQYFNRDLRSHQRAALDEELIPFTKVQFQSLMDIFQSNAAPAGGKRNIVHILIDMASQRA